MTTHIIAKQDALIAEFSKTAEPILGPEIMSMIAARVKHLTVHIQPTPHTSDHSVAFSRPIPTGQPMLRIQIEWVDPVTNLQQVVLNRHIQHGGENVAELFYNTGHDLIICVASLDGVADVYTVSDVEDYPTTIRKAFMGAGDSSLIRVIGGFVVNLAVVVA